MEFMNGEGPSFIPFTQLIRKATNQSPIHLSTREESWAVKEDKLVYVPSGCHSSSYEECLPFHYLKRGIFTILLPCTQILVVNSAACKLLNYSSDELCTMKLLDLIQDQHKQKLITMSNCQLIDSNEGGSKKEKLLSQIWVPLPVVDEFFHVWKSKLEQLTTDLMESLQEYPCKIFGSLEHFGSSKVEMVSKDGDVIPASLFFKKIDSPQRCLAVVEPIDRKTALLTVDSSCKIVSCDDEGSNIFQYDSSELIGTDIRNLIPFICLDFMKENRCDVSYKQRLTGRTKSGSTFPLYLIINRSNTLQGCWQIMVWMFLNLNGLIILNKDFRISNCNYQFMKLLFGSTMENVQNQKITKFIPTFCEGVKLMGKHADGFAPSEKRNSPSMKEKKTWRLSFISSKEKEPERKPIPSYADECLPSPGYNCKINCKIIEGSPRVRLSKSDHDIRSGCESSLSESKEKLISSREIESDRFDLRDSGRNNDSSQESNRGIEQKNGNCYLDCKHLGLREGYFSGYGKHLDGNEINIYYKVKIISFGEKLFYCVWISGDPWEVNDVGPNMPTTTITGSASIISTSMDDSGTKDSSCNEDLTRLSSASIISHNDEILTGGEYSEHYTNLEQIGKGAFGYVKMAFRHVDGLLVITKFIKKHKINVQSWVYDPNWSIKIPLEISLLANLKHPNIIEVLDVFHNDSFFQLVMKKHGAGMDLFEFIERKPKSDEKLNSYIFRQIISAVRYLDSIGILHRDIKDENVIINEKFEVKLIDFGSAAFRPPGKMFSVFYGTVEYCSPEVLQGNKYRGPELEIWALGVTLYVLTFGENPFYDVQETIKGKFSIPIMISSSLFDLLHKMLEKDVGSRITISKVSSHPWVTQPVDISNYRFEDVVHCNPTESDPPQYLTEFSLENPNVSDQNLDEDGDRTMASSNSFYSLQTTENTENFDQYDENLQDLSGDFLSDDSAFKSSTPVSDIFGCKNRGDLTKSAGALNRVCEMKNQICDRCNSRKFVKKRFSLDMNILKGFSGSGGRYYSESDDSSFECLQKSKFNDKLESKLINDLDEIKLARDKDSIRRYLREESEAERERSETEGCNLSSYPEFYCMS